MPRQAKNLSVIAIKNITSPGRHPVGHVPGLCIQVGKTGGRSWILRTKVGNKRKDIGLGGFTSKTLTQVKEEAAQMRQDIRNGIDPTLARKEAQATLKAEQASFITFEEAAEAFIAAHRDSWRNSKHAAQWPSTLKQYVYPAIGNLHVKEVSLEHVLSIIEPIWHSKTETANRVRGRIERILNWAKARGYRQGENPAQWRGNLDSILPSPKKIKKVKHYPAIDFKDIYNFMSKLSLIDGYSARALEFSILTACRTGSARGARWSEIDFERKLWTIPVEEGRAKSGKVFRVALSEAAIRLLKKVPKLDGCDFIFPNRKGTPFSDATLSLIVRNIGAQAVPHGFRSTFRDWAGEASTFTREVIEHAMSHKVYDESEAAYARGDQFTKRLKLMNAWGEFLSRPYLLSDNVTPFKRSA